MVIIACTKENVINWILLRNPENPDTGALAEIVEDMRDRLEAVEKRQNEILDELHKLRHH